MGLLDRFRTDTATPGSEPTAIEIDADLAETLRAATVDAGPVVSIVPYERESGMQRNRQFFRNVWNTTRAGKRRQENVSPPWAFELVYRASEETIEPRYVAPDPHTRDNITTDAESVYSNADIEARPERFADFDVGQSVAIASLRLRETDGLDHLKPISNYKINPEDFDVHPYDNITSVMATTGPDGEASSVVTQVVCRPAISITDVDGLAWYDGCLDLYEQLKDAETQSVRWAAVLDELLAIFDGGGESVQYTKTETKTNKHSQAAEMVADLNETLGFDVNVRIVAFAADDAEARRRVASVAEKYQSFYNAQHGQGFLATYPDDTDAVRETLLRAVGREWVDHEMPMDLWSLAGLAGPPMPITTRGYVTTRQRNDAGAPSSLADFETVDRTGYFDGESPLSETPLADVEADDP